MVYQSMLPSQVVKARKSVEALNRRAALRIHSSNHGFVIGTSAVNNQVVLDQLSIMVNSQIHI